MRIHPPWIVAHGPKTPLEGGGARLGDFWLKPRSVPMYIPIFRSHFGRKRKASIQQETQNGNEGFLQFSSADFSEIMSWDEICNHT